jgi:hypothetical protein
MENTDTTAPKTTSVSKTEEKTQFYEGETAILKDVSVTFLGVTESMGSTFNYPTDGNVFVLCEFEIANNSDKEINVSSMLSFEAYCDDYTCTFSLTALMEKGNKNQLDGTVAPGKKFKGVISPDFSIYRDMPLCMQIWNTYRGRALAVWMHNNGIEVIPNIRFGDIRTFSFCFDGIEKGKTVAVGTHGCIKKKEDRQFFKTGLEKLVKELNPKNIIVYGRAPNSIFKSARDAGINFVVFESEFSKSRKRGDA